MRAAVRDMQTPAGVARTSHLPPLPPSPPLATAAALDSLRSPAPALPATPLAASAALAASPLAAAPAVAAAAAGGDGGAGPPAPATGSKRQRRRTNTAAAPATVAESAAARGLTSSGAPASATVTAASPVVATAAATVAAAASIANRRRSSARLRAAVAPVALEIEVTEQHQSGSRDPHLAAAEADAGIVDGFVPASRGSSKMRTTSRKPASNSKKAAAAAAEAAAAAAPAAPDSGASDDGTAGAGGSNTSSASGEAAAGAEAPPSKLCRRKAAEAAEDGGDVAAAAPPAAKKARRKTKAELAEEVRQGVSRGDLPPHVVLHERFPHSRDYAAGAVPLPAAALEVAQRRNDEISAAAVAAAAAAALAAAASSAAATQAAMAASGGAGAVQALQVAVAEAGALGVLAAMSNTAAAGSAGAYAGGAATSGSDEGPGSAGASEREGSAGTAAAQELAAKEEEEEQQCGRKRRGRAAKPKGKKAAAAAAAAAAGGEVEGQEQVAAGGEEAAEAGPAGPAPPPVRPMPDHIPNLGYACLCATMREHDVYASRDTNKAGFTGKGLPHVSRLALANARDLLPLLRWNEAHGIRLFRLSSGIFPWMSFYELEELPDAEGIKQALAEVGEVAKQLGHRLTFHPSEFTKIASDKPEVVETSVKELEVHSRIFDLMGFLPASVYNKINIHVGGVYGDKVASMDRFAKVVLERLSPNCRARLTVENDDRASMYSVADLTYLAAKAHIPIVFDFHHHRFCTGGLTEEQAFRTALATWPPGVRPVVHWSESQAGRRPHAHSDYVSGPIYLYGMEKEVDVMIESKAKELALLHYRQAALQGLAAARPEDQQEPEEDEEGTK